MDIRITDHGNIWVDGKQYIGLDSMNQLLQEKGAIDYDRIQAIVAEAVKTPDITEEQVRAFCKARNWTIYDKALLDDRLASQYRLGYNEGAKDADERFKVLKAELLKKYKTGIEKWVAQHKDEFYTDSFSLLRAGITVGKMTLEALLKDDPKFGGCDWID
jgi:hypothetical protein